MLSSRRVELPQGHLGVTFRGRPPRISAISRDSPLRDVLQVGQYPVALITPSLELYNFDHVITLTKYLVNMSGHQRILEVSDAWAEARSEDPTTFRLTIRPYLYLGLQFSENNQNRNGLVINQILDDSPLKKSLEKGLVLKQILIPGERVEQGPALTPSKAMSALTRSQDKSGRVLIFHKEEQVMVQAMPDLSVAELDNSVPAEVVGGTGCRDVVWDPTDNAAQATAVEFASTESSTHDHVSRTDGLDQVLSWETEDRSSRLPDEAPSGPVRSSLPRATSAVAVPVRHSLIRDAPMAAVVSESSSSGQSNVQERRRGSKLQTHVDGSHTQLLTVTLWPDQLVKASSGSMLYMTDGVHMIPTKQNYSAELRSGSRVALTEFYYKDERFPSGQVAFGFTNSSKILSLNLNELGGKVIYQCGALLCCEQSMSVKVEFAVSPETFGGEGIILHAIEGTGTVFLCGGGFLVEKVLQDGEKLQCSSSALMAFAQSVLFVVELMSDTHREDTPMMLTLTGPGKVWMARSPLVGRR